MDDQLPILTPGIHDFELSEIGNHFLQDFTASKTRAFLVDNFVAYTKYLLEIGVPVEIWIDGSFTTTKLDPNDIDLVVFSPGVELNALPLAKQELFKALIDRRSIKSKLGLDVLFCPAENSEMRSYWRGWFGFDRNEHPKGIARVKVAV